MKSTTYLLIFSAAIITANEQHFDQIRYIKHSEIMFN